MNWPVMAVMPVFHTVQLSLVTLRCKTIDTVGQIGRAQDLHAFAVHAVAGDATLVGEVGIGGRLAGDDRIGQ